MLEKLQIWEKALQPKFFPERAKGIHSEISGIAKRSINVENKGNLTKKTQKKKKPNMFACTSARAFATVPVITRIVFCIKLSERHFRKE